MLLSWAAHPKNHVDVHAGTELGWDETTVDVVFFKESTENGDHSI